PTAEARLRAANPARGLLRSGEVTGPISGEQGAREPECTSPEEPIGWAGPCPAISLWPLAWKALDPKALNRGRESPCRDCRSGAGHHRGTGTVRDPHRTPVFQEAPRPRSCECPAEI